MPRRLRAAADAFKKRLDALTRGRRQRVQRARVRRHTRRISRPRIRLPSLRLHLSMLRLPRRVASTNYKPDDSIIQRAEESLVYNNKLDAPLWATLARHEHCVHSKNLVRLPAPGYIEEDMQLYLAVRHAPDALNITPATISQEAHSTYAIALMNYKARLAEDFTSLIGLGPDTAQSGQARIPLDDYMSRIINAPVEFLFYLKHRISRFIARLRGRRDEYYSVVPCSVYAFPTARRRVRRQHRQAIRVCLDRWCRRRLQVWRNG